MRPGGQVSKPKRIVWNFFVSMTLLAPAFSIEAAEPTGHAPQETNSEVPFPDGYPAWRHVKSVVIGPGHKSFATEGGKIFQFYANAQAVEGYSAGKFPNGSVIVRETLRATPGDGDSKGILNE